MGFSELCPSILIIMSVSEAQIIIEMLDIHFDAHDFIVMFIKTFPHSYFKILAKYDCNVRQTDAQIGSFLQKNANLLCISEIGKVVSLNIMSNQTECMSWRKL